MSNLDVALYTAFAVCWFWAAYDKLKNTDYGVSLIYLGLGILSLSQVAKGLA